MGNVYTVAVAVALGQRNGMDESKSLHRFYLMLYRNSYEMLSMFGIDSISVRNKVNEMLKIGTSQDTAFQTAVIEVGLQILG